MKNIIIYSFFLILSFSSLAAERCSSLFPLIQQPDGSRVHWEEIAQSIEEKVDRFPQIIKKNEVMRELTSIREQLEEWNILIDEARKTGATSDIIESETEIQSLVKRLEKIDDEIEKAVSKAFGVSRNSNGNLTEIKPPKIVRRHGVSRIIISKDSVAHTKVHFLSDNLSRLTSDEIKALETDFVLRLKTVNKLATSNPINTMFPSAITRDRVLQELVYSGAAWEETLEKIDPFGRAVYKIKVNIEGKLYGIKIVICVKGSCAKAGKRGHLITLIPRCGADILVIPNLRGRREGYVPHRGQPCDRYF